MKKSKRLQVVLEMAQRKEQEAAQALGYLQQRLAEEQGKLSSLQQYGDEYHQALRSPARQGMNGQRLQSYIAFLGRLNDAVAQQQEQLLTLQRQQEQVKQHWFKMRGRVKALESVIAAARLEEQTALDKAEQKAQDERASQLFMQRHGRLAG